MNNYAQDWANRLAMTGNFHHRKDNIYGENLYASSSSKDLGKKAVDSWYNEIIYYDANANENQLFANKAIRKYFIPVINIKSLMIFEVF